MLLQGECHTRQHFHYMGQTGELHADQAHRGYNTATDESGYAALNPLYMRSAPGLQDLAGPWLEDQGGSSGGS